MKHASLHPLLAAATLGAVLACAPGAPPAVSSDGAARAGLLTPVTYYVDAASGGTALDSDCTNRADNTARPFFTIGGAFACIVSNTGGDLTTGAVSGPHTIEVADGGTYPENVVLGGLTTDGLNPFQLVGSVNVPPVLTPVDNSAPALNVDIPNVQVRGLRVLGPGPVGILINDTTQVYGCGVSGFVEGITAKGPWAAGSDISGNAVDDSANAGIRILGAADSLVAFNDVMAVAGAVGISVIGTSGVSVEHNRVTGGSCGVCLLDSPGTTVRNNTVNNTVNGAQNYGVRAFASSGAVLRNNIIQTGTTAFASGIVASTSPGLDSDYNLVYRTSPAANFGDFDGTSYPTRFEWSQATGADTNSLEADPMFVALDDYHLRPGSPAIDAGDDSPFGDEPFYNGLRINLGRYGNTPEATPLPFSGFMWTGSAGSDDWTNPQDWIDSGGTTSLPGINDDAVISCAVAGTPAPVIFVTASARVHNLILDDCTLTVHGSLIVSGALSVSGAAGAVNINGGTVSVTGPTWIDAGALLQMNSGTMTTTGRLYNGARVEMFGGTLQLAGDLINAGNLWADLSHVTELIGPMDRMLDVGAATFGDLAVTIGGSGSATATVVGNVDVDGPLAIESGTLRLRGTLLLGGDLINNATVAAEESAFIFDGGADQFIGGGGTFRSTLTQTLAFEDFEGGGGLPMGWVTSTGADWEAGLPQGGGTVSGFYTSDPTRAVSGAFVLGTDLGDGTAAADGDYPPSTFDALCTADIPAGQADEVLVRFWRHLNVNAGDSATVAIAAPGSNPTCVTLAGDTPIAAQGGFGDLGWTHVEHVIALGGVSALRLRFAIESNAPSQRGGWNIDDLEVIARATRDGLPDVRIQKSSGNVVVATNGDLVVAGDLHVDAGGLVIPAGRRLDLEHGWAPSPVYPTIEAGASLVLDASNGLNYSGAPAPATLALSGRTRLSAYGLLKLDGAASAMATIINTNSLAGGYGLSVFGSLDASNFVVSGGDTEGLLLDANATVNRMEHGKFLGMNPSAPPASYITLGGISAGTVFTNVWFDAGAAVAPGDAFNVTASCGPQPCSGTVTIIADGPLAGDEFDLDPNDQAGLPGDPFSPVSSGSVLWLLACGNGGVDDANGEQCDDGGRAPGDGCDPWCQIESGWCCIGGGNCIIDGTINSPCEVCDAAQSQTSWTPADSKACSDGDPCTTGETCWGGICQGGRATCPDDGIPCTSATCDATTGGCSLSFDDSACNDNAPCTSDLCMTTGCSHTWTCACGNDSDCDDNNPCTRNTCPAGSCVTTPDNSAGCDLGDPCTVLDTCFNGGCIAGVSRDVSDGIACTVDSCNGSGTITHFADNSRCPSQGGCMSAGLCDPSIDCVYAMAGDGDPCNNGIPCSQNDHCEGGTCVSDAAGCAPPYRADFWPSPGATWKGSVGKPLAVNVRLVASGGIPTVAAEQVCVSAVGIAGGTPTLDAPDGCKTTNAATGRARFEVTDSLAEEVVVTVDTPALPDSAPPDDVVYVLFVPDTADAIRIVTDGAPVPACVAADVTLEIIDAYGNRAAPPSNGVTVSLAATSIDADAAIIATTLDGQTRIGDEVSGRMTHATETVTVGLPTAGTLQLTATTVAGLTAGGSSLGTVEFAGAQPDRDASRLAAAAGEIIAGGDGAEITLTAVDSCGEALTGDHQVVLTSTRGIMGTVVAGDGGTYRASLSAYPSECPVDTLIAATIDGVPAGEVITVAIACPPSGAASAPTRGCTAIPHATATALLGVLLLLLRRRRS